MSSISGASGYVLEPLRQSADFTLYRGRQHADPTPVLAIALSAEQPSPQSLHRLEHEYSLAAELDPAWAVKPLVLTRHEGRTILLLKDPGGEPLDRILERDQGQPVDLTRSLSIAIGLATALGQVHRHGLIHKDIKPANVLVGNAGKVWLTGFGIASQLPRERQSLPQRTRPVSQCSQECHQILLFLRRKFRAEDQVEELDRVLQRQQTLVVHIGRVIL